MPASKFDRINSGDNALDRVQGNVAKAIDPVLSVALLDGRLVEDDVVAGALVPITLSTTPKDVAHGLGREYRGWIVVDKNANADVWVDPPTGTPLVDPNPDRALFIRLDASAAVTVKLWVF